MRALIALVVLAAAAAAEDAPITYPESKRIDHVDDYHGMQVADPYRWLEQDVRESAEVADWVRRENEVTFGYLEAIPERDEIRKRVEGVWNYAKVSAYFKAGGRYYFFKNDGLQNQDVLYTAARVGGDAEVLIDPNQWSGDGTVALGAISFSEGGRYVAYAVNEAGSDWQSWRVMDLRTRQELGDRLEWVKFSGAAWTPDDRGFFYSRFPEPEEGAAFQSTNLNQKVYYHRVGTAQADDVLVYERPDEPEWGFTNSVSSDGRWLVITVWKGTAEKYRIVYKDLHEPYGLPRELVTSFDDEMTFLDASGERFYFQTDRGAPTRRIVAVDLARPEPESWEEVVAPAEETLVASSLVGNLFVCEYLKDARSQVLLHTLRGELVREVELPGIGTAGGFWGKRSDTETFYTFSGYATPPTVVRYDLATGKSEAVFETELSVDVSQYETKQVFYESADGTHVPLFLTYRKGLELDGRNPTLLYGYGGFNISITPAFSARWLSWLDLGGVLAVANLRGGGEYGEEWHLAGTKTKKQNVFDDFIAAAEWLIANKYTSPEKLAIHGRSNGGLLVGAVMTQRPELFGATLPAVGVMDMLRFHQFTAGRYWVDDYGSADDPREFESIYAYSPYHSLRKHSEYPPTLVTTADTDDRVVPGHSFKFAAELQHRQKGDAPVLIRIETSAGHGAGKPTSKLIDEIADQWAFLVKNLGMEID